MSVTDFHTHAFPNALAPRALAQLARNVSEKQPLLDGTVGDLLRSMDRAGIERSVVYSIATAPEQFEAILAFCESIRSERIAPFPSVHPKSLRAAEEIRRIAAAGFRGIKLHPCYQDIAADAPETIDVCEAAAGEGIIVAFHAGEDFAFPDADVSHPRRIANVAERFGDLVIIATHLGGYRRWKEVLDVLAGRENVIFETSFAFREIPRPLLDEILARHGTERILFGTDSPWRDQTEAIDELQAQRLGEEIERAILEENATRLLG